MLFKKFNKNFEKISANIDKETATELDNIALFYLCSRTDIINKALKDYIKKHKKKISKLKED